MLFEQPFTPSSAGVAAQQPSEPPTINIQKVTVGGPGAPGQDVPIGVEVNNRELLAPQGKPWGCPDVGTDSGHKVDVAVEVVDQQGRTVESQTKRICANVNLPLNSQRIEVPVRVNSPGSYGVWVTLNVPGFGAPSDTSQPVGLTITRSPGGLPGDGSGSGDSGGDGDDSSDGNPLEKLLETLNLSTFDAVAGSAVLVVILVLFLVVAAGG